MLVPNSRQGQFDTTGKIDAMDMTGFFCDHNANQFKININGIKMNNDERRRHKYNQYCVSRIS